MLRNRAGLKIQKVGPKAKRPQKNNKKNIPTHPMTMPLKRLVKTFQNFCQKTPNVSSKNEQITRIE